MKLFSERRKSENIILYSLVTAALLTAVGVFPLQYAKAQDNPDDTFTLNLKNADISTLIETVAARTGRTFIVDPRVKATINVVSSEPLNADKLYDLFLSVLAVHGFAAVQAGALTKIVPASVGIQSAVPIYSEDSKAEDDLVSRVIQLNNLSALEVVEALRPLFPESASINAETTSNTIVITDSVANIEKLIELIVLMDEQ